MPTLVLWPDSELKCLSDADKSAVQTGVHCGTAVDQNEVCLLNLERFSKLSILLRIATLVFKFINRLKQSNSNPVNDAKVYKVKCV